MGDLHDDKAVQELFQRWLDSRILRGGERDPAELCADAPQLLPRLEQLIERYRLLDDVMPSPSGPSESSNAKAPAVERFEVGEVLGQGGMGVVWRAEQVLPVQRPVALKVIQRGRNHRAILRRFEAERQALASMDHPSIAKLFEAGATADDQPYYAMELVDGTSIVDYCDEHRLTLRQRLDLFVRVCAGVEHAHQKGILHRDLKPSNILVATQDGRPQPKIIDFGVAKAIEPKAAGDATLTQLGQVVGTPAYMSPEQVDPDLPAPDTRSDVYALGVILYELLVGVRPSDVPAPLPNVPTPSSRLSTLSKDRTSGERAAHIADLRRTEVGPLVRQLRGDLDWIVLKCLDTDRERRYGSPSALAEDLGRYFRSEPVFARPSGAIYVLAKFSRRHRLAVAVGCVLTLALLSALAGLAVGLDRARRAERIAQAESRVAVRVSDFLVGLFRLSNPKAEGGATDVRGLLDLGAERIDGELEDQPRVRARLLETMAEAYQGLGELKIARDLVLRSIEVRSATDPDGAAELAAAYQRLGGLHRQLGDSEAALEAARFGLELRKTVSPPDYRALSQSHRQVGTALDILGRQQEALVALEASRGALERAGDGQDLEMAKLLNNTAIVHMSGNEYATAKPLMEQGLAIFEARLGPEHPHVASNLNNLAMAEQELGELEAAERHHRRALEIREALFEPHHPDIAESLNNLSNVLLETGKIDEAERKLERSLEIRRVALGEDHPWFATSLFNLGRASAERGDLQDARVKMVEGLRVAEAALGGDHTIIATYLRYLGRVESRSGMLASAEARFQRCVEIQASLLGPADPGVAPCLEPYAELLVELGRSEEAEAMSARAASMVRGADG